jgi:transcriptional regulator with XRE-family HTH domain
MSRAHDTPSAREARRRVAQAVVAIRRYRQLSQKALAERSRMSVSTISRFERAQSPMPINTLVAIAHGLQVPVELLLDAVSVNLLIGLEKASEQSEKLIRIN